MSSSQNIDPVIGRFISGMLRLGMARGNIVRAIADETQLYLEDGYKIYNTWAEELADRQEPAENLAVGDIVAQPQQLALIFAAVVNVEKIGGETYVTLKDGRRYWRVLARAITHRYAPLPERPVASAAWVAMQQGRDGVWDYIGEADDVDEALGLIHKATPPYERVAIMSGKLWNMGNIAPVLTNENDVQIAVKLG